MKLTIFGGITGFNKSEFIRSFVRKCLEKHEFPAVLSDPESCKFIHYIKFEDVLLELTGLMDISRFISKPSLDEKIIDIERTYTKIASRIEDIEAEHVFLDIHLSCLSQSQFFSPFSASNLNELDPQSNSEIKVITLIDDVFQIWNILKQREDEFPNTSLRLREILAWRSVESLFGEIVALNYTTADRRVTNYMFAVRHPFISLYNLVFSQNPICVYLSFPITNTRNVPERIAEINSYRQKMYEFAEEHGIVVFDPVTIDEYALILASKENGKHVLRAVNRWPLDIELLISEPSWPISIPDNEVEEVESDIKNQIKPRDFKLVDSSIITSVYRKNYGGYSKGVTDEIRYAVYRGNRVFVYDPPEDSESDEPHPFDLDVLGFRNVNEFYDNIVKGIENYKARRST